MLKNRKTGKPVTIYAVNVLPTKNFEEIYKIKEIFHISVTIEAFRGKQKVNQCYLCQGYDHASEVCNFTPKCCRHGEEHLSPSCTYKGRITRKCANCGGQHPSSYRGCTKIHIVLRILTKRIPIKTPLKAAKNLSIMKP